MGEESGKIDYHSGFYAAMHAVYRHARADFELPHEQELGIKPLRLDMALVRRGDQGELTDAIGRSFRRLNVLEYKSPEDSLSIDDIFKTQAYVSGAHAQLLFRPESGWCIADRGSSNGTKLNDHRLQPDVEMSIKNGDIVTIANVVLKVVISVN